MEGSKCIYFCFARKKGELEIFAQSISEVSALDSSVSRELPVSVLFGLYMDYLNPLHFWLIFQRIRLAYRNLAGLRHALKRKCGKEQMLQIQSSFALNIMLVPLGSQDCVAPSVHH